MGPEEGHMQIDGAVASLVSTLQPVGQTPKSHGLLLSVWPPSIKDILIALSFSFFFFFSYQ